MRGEIMRRSIRSNSVSQREPGATRVMLWSVWIVALAVGAAVPAWAQYSIVRFTTSGGGAMGTSGGGYTLGGTIGQPLAGGVSGGGYSVGGGFWSGGGTPVGIGDPGGEIASLPQVYRLGAPGPNPS